MKRCQRSAVLPPLLVVLVLILGSGCREESLRGGDGDRIVTADDGKSYRSTVRYEVLDQTGRPIDGGGEAEGQGVRIGF